MAKQPFVPSPQLLMIHTFALRAVSQQNVAAELTMRQVGVLTSIRLGHAPEGVKSLAKYLKINKPAVTRALDRLTSLGLVERLSHETDRRMITVALTGDGLKFLKTLDTLA